MIVDTIAKLEREDIKSIEAEKAAEDAWCDLVEQSSSETLLPLTSSWWTGDNIPGKKTQMLTYVGGIAKYEVQCREKLGKLEGFKVVSAA